MGYKTDESIAKLIIKSVERLGYKVFQTKQSESKYTLTCSEVNSKNIANNEYYYKLNKADSIEDKKDSSEFSSLIFKNYHLGI